MVRKVINRRDFIVSASSVAGFCVLNCDALAQQVAPPTIVRALDDPDVIHGRVTFRSGSANIDAYLARPRKKGRYHIVIVITGNSIDEEYIQNTTAMLAQKGFLGIAPNIYSLQKTTMTAEEKRKVFAEQITDERIFQDLQASIDYLKQQPFAKPGGIGIMGFCFGGRCALMFAAQSKEIKAVAPFYGNLRTPAFANRKQDPLDVLDRIRVPVQGHYSDSDPEIPAEQLQTLEQTLKKQRTPVEIFTYKAPHGFFSYTRKTYDKTAAEDSWKRTAEFFQRVSANSGDYQMKKSRSIANAVRRFGEKVITCTKHIVFLFGALIVFLTTCAQERIGYTQTVGADKPVEQVRKNIQVLKGLPDSQLFPVMNAVGDALGVKCDYCHVKRGEKYYNGDWVYASDEKPQKLRGREMMKMVLEINKTNFGGNQKVTCYSCHRGGQSVARIVPLPPLDLVALGNTEAKPALPTAEQILNKYVAAVGQPAALAKLKTTVLKGKIERSAGRPSDSVEITIKGADKYLVKLTTPQGVRTQAINGTTGWVKINDDAKELPPTAVADAKRSLILYAAVKVAEQPAQMTVLGMENVGDRETYVLTSTVDAKTTKKFFFDARSGLLVRRITITETILSPLQEQTDFEDYRDVDGVKLPFTIRTSELAAFATATRKFSEIRHNAAVDDAVFEFPQNPK